MDRTKAILSKSRANDLIIRGNELIRIEDSIKNPNKVVFIFSVTDKLLKDIDELATKYQK